jgi:predicted Ser/Thr protein kinase/tetratricopeptide (TPR) repeat protein
MKSIGKYTIVKILGQGAMGTVYKALDPDIDREVAIKTVNFGPQIEEGHEDVIKRFLREAQSAGKLTHPNIVTIYEVGRDGDMTYIVMQYVEGQSLQKLISGGKKFSHDEILHLMGQICSGLDTAHAKGIIHRDIKPANILIDKAGDAHIVDFGVAHVETSTMTMTGMTLGTPSYMSPEQVMGKKVDGQSDVFSLGVVLYEMITGKRPFHADNVTTLIYKIINEEPPALSSFKHVVPEYYEAVILRALAKNQKERFRTCGEMMAALGGEFRESGAVIQEAGAFMENDAPGRRRRILLGALASALAVVAIAIALLVTGGEKKTGLSGGGGAPPPVVQAKKPPAEKQVAEETQTEEPAADQTQGDEPQPVNPPTDKVQEDNPQQEKIQAEKVQPDDAQAEPEESEPGRSLKEMQSLLDAGEFASAQSMGETLLADFPDDPGIPGLLEKAKNGLKAEEESRRAGEISRMVQNGIAQYNQGRFREAIAAMNEVLAKDNENRQARRYIGMADRELSKAQILRLLKRQEEAEENKNLNILMSDMGSGGVSEQRREGALLLFNFYDNIESVMSNISIAFRDSRHATVKFSSMVTAVYKKNNQKTVVSEGLKTWELEKRGNDWKVVSLK